MSQLVEHDPDVYQDPKPEGQEYGCFIFEQLLSVSTMQNMSLKANTDVNDINSSSADSV